MSYFPGDYLRILTPQTTDGVNLKYGVDQKPVYKEMHLPLSARKQMEKKNEKRPLHLRHIIEHVTTALPVKPKASPKPAEVETEDEAVDSPKTKAKTK